jgi:UDP-2,4-diacetamido-2,4,6-trideoxy-beta-L-altropyranose hydrolase
MNNKKTIVFRADGNSQIGLGHIMRCLALCEILSQDFFIKFAIQNPSNEVYEILSKNVNVIINLGETADYNSDFVLFSSYITNDDIVVLDGYFFDEEYQKRIKLQCRKLVFIDDLVKGHQYADVVINHNGLVNISDYEAEKYTQFFLGTKYALLRKEFFNKDYKKQDIHSINKGHIFINLGGADPNNIALRIVNTLMNNDHSLTITLILGIANTNLQSYEPFNEQGKLIIKKGLSAEQMVEEIRNCDLAIVSCSTISYEVATLNKPFVGIVTAENQKSNAIFFKKNDVAVAILEKNFSDSELLDCFSTNVETLQKTLERQQYFFDNNVFDRIKSIFINL